MLQWKTLALNILLIWTICDRYEKGSRKIFRKQSLWTKWII